MVTVEEFQGFGRIFAPSKRALHFGKTNALPDLAKSNGGLLTHGSGLSYGDSCLNSAGILVLMRDHARILAFDPETGLLYAQAGIRLAEIVAATAPHGWFLPVTPGTKFVTLGGAIANDVHGKNHHVRGAFGRHVEGLTLMRSDGRTLDLGPADKTGLFAATIGGMGLTGIIADATVRMMKVPGLDIEETVMPFDSLEGYFDGADDVDEAFEYSVAWIDQSASGKQAGRGLLFAGRHRADGRFDVRGSKPRLSMPFTPPINLVGKPVITVFNRAYRAIKGRAAGARRANYDSYFYPLDGIGNWNRLYGPRGFFQHQSVVPAEAARETVALLLRRSRESGHASFLSVLKRFGDVPSPGLLSFPRPGYTLTLDFANGGTRTLSLLDELDAITIDAGGAVNPYKDARMSARTFRRSFPEWGQLEEKRDPAFVSDFWRRTALKT